MKFFSFLTLAAIVSASDPGAPASLRGSEQRVIILPGRFLKGGEGGGGSESGAGGGGGGPGGGGGGSASGGGGGGSIKEGVV